MFIIGGGWRIYSYTFAKIKCINNMHRLNSTHGHKFTKLKPANNLAIHQNFTSTKSPAMYTVFKNKRTETIFTHVPHWKRSKVSQTSKVQKTAETICYGRKLP